MNYAGLAVDEDTTLGGDAAATAVFSPDRAYRYALTRRWSDADPAVFLMLNPSTAGAHRGDPTVTRCIGYARDWRCGGLIVLNAFALVSTDPAALETHPDPVGPRNDEVIADQLARSGTGPVVAAWGATRLVRARGRDVRLRELVAAHRPGRGLACLGTTSGGHPRHPVRMPAAAQLRAWTW